MRPRLSPLRSNDRRRSALRFQTRVGLSKIHRTTQHITKRDPLKHADTTPGLARAVTLLFDKSQLTTAGYTPQHTISSFQVSSSFNHRKNDYNKKRTEFCCSLNPPGAHYTTRQSLTHRPGQSLINATKINRSAQIATHYPS